MRTMAAMPELDIEMTPKLVTPEVYAFLNILGVQFGRELQDFALDNNFDTTDMTWVARFTDGSSARLILSKVA